MHIYGWRLAIGSAVLVCGGCASAPEAAPVLTTYEQVSSTRSLLERAGAEDVDPSEASVLREDAMDWSRLEAAVAEAARDNDIKIPQGKVRSAARLYAHEINRVEQGGLQQFHLDRAAIVLEREVFSGVTLAEGATLRGRVSGGGGGSSRSSGSRSRGSSRDIGRSGSTSSSGSRTSGTNSTN